MAMIEIEEKAIGAVHDALGGLHGRLVKMGRSLDARFHADKIHARSNVVEAIGSLVESIENTTNALEKSIADSAAEQQRLAKEAAEVPELKKMAEQLLEKCEAISAK